jgi:hypothetical protein
LALFTAINRQPKLEAIYKGAIVFSEHNSTPNTETPLPNPENLKHDLNKTAVTNRKTRTITHQLSKSEPIKLI